MIYTIYCVATGRIEKTVVTDNILTQIQDGHDYIEGAFDDDAFYIESDVPVAIPQKPDGEAYFDYSTKQWVLDSASQQEKVKSRRNLLLQSSDWTQLPDVPLETKQAWATYRQALRDITTQEGYPFNVIWPTKPE